MNVLHREGTAGQETRHVVGQLRFIRRRHPFKVEVVVPYQIGRKPRIRNATTTHRQPAIRVVFQISPIEHHRVLVKTVAQRLVGRNRRSDIASTQTQPRRPVIGHLDIHAKTHAQQRTLAIFGRIVHIDAEQGQLRGRGVVLLEQILLQAQPHIAAQLETTHPVRHGTGVTPALALGLRQHFTLDLFANFPLHRFRHILHAHHVRISGLRGLFRLRLLRCGLRHRCALDQHVRLVARQQALLYQRLNQVERGLAQRLHFLLLACLRALTRECQCQYGSNFGHFYLHGFHLNVSGCLKS